MKKTSLLLALTTFVGNVNLARRVRLWAVLGLLSVPAFGPPPAQAAVTEAWVHRYSNVVSNSKDEALKVASDAAGDIIVTGTTDDGITGQDMLTIKYSGVDGSVLWQKRYNGPANSYDNASAVAVDGSGNVVVTGSSYSNRTNIDYYTAKYAAADGALLWEKRYNGPANNFDRARAVAVDGSGNVVVTGFSNNGTNDDYCTAKYAAADGALLWEKRYNGPAKSDDRASALAVDGSGNVVVTGFSGVRPQLDYYTAKYAAADGALLWEKRYNGPANGDDEANALAVDGSGNVVVTGGSVGDGGFADCYTAKYAAADGTLLWEKRYNGPANDGDGARAIAVDSSGNVVVTGFSYNATVTDYYTDYYTAKYAAADGALLWEQRYSGPSTNSIDQANAVAVDGSGNVVVTGGSQGDFYTAKYAGASGALLWEQRYIGGGGSALVVGGRGNVVVTGSFYKPDGFNGGSSDYYTAKYAAVNGALLWEQRYNGVANNLDEARAVTVDGNGNVVVTGSSYNGTESDYYTAKYAAADGALLWEQRYNGPANSYDEARALAVDGNGNVVVTGDSQGDFYTAKYAAADGALLWEQRYNGPANYGDSARALAVDGSGNVVVTGVSYNKIGDDGYYDGDYYTAKYAAADGTLLWEKRYNGPANGTDEPRTVAADSSGNVVVTGVSQGDVYTAKYAAADGALLWEKRSNAGGQAVAVDASGNVVATGSSYNGNNSDYYTAKYAAADGTLLWEKRYNAPANDDDRANAVAVDGSGNVVVMGLSVGRSYPNYNIDYYTAKYAAADGALIWEQRYSPAPAYHGDQANAVAVDGSGNVVVTGNSQNGPPNYDTDYYTAKYAATDGALLWEKRYNGPGKGADRVGTSRSLALGPNGMVAITGTSSGDYATVVYRENLPPISIELIPIGVRLRFTGVPARSYNIERAHAITGPWTTLASPIAPNGGLLEYLDTPSPPGQAFYRAVWR